MHIQPYTVFFVMQSCSLHKNTFKSIITFLRSLHLLKLCFFFSLNNCDLNKHNSDNRKSVPNPIKKVYAAHDVHENCTEKIESDIEEKEKFLSGTKLDRTVSISNLEVKPRNNNQTVETQNTGSLSTWNSAARAPAKSKTDSTVQTDWCSMLVSIILNTISNTSDDLVKVARVP